jgi:GNAT superfamily N-acetyltransferase
VRLRSLADAPEAFTSSYKRESQFDEVTWRERAKTCHWFVAECEGEAVGIAGGVVGWSGDPTRRELVGMWVAPSHRGRGLARSLLDRVAEWAGDEGATTLVLGVRQGNHAARSAYLSMGLRMVGCTAEFGNPDATIELMELQVG